MTKTKYAEITIEEAIENLQFYLDTPFPKRASAADLYTINRHKEALSMAIDVLKCQNSLSTLNIKEDDTIILTVDPDLTDICFASDYAKGLAKVFPTNNIIVKVKGIDVDIEGVNKHDD